MPPAMVLKLESRMSYQLSEPNLVLVLTVFEMVLKVEQMKHLNEEEHLMLLQLLLLMMLLLPYWYPELFDQWVQVLLVTQY